MPGWRNGAPVAASIPSGQRRAVGGRHRPPQVEADADDDGRVGAGVLGMHFVTGCCEHGSQCGLRHRRVLVGEEERDERGRRRRVRSPRCTTAPRLALRRPPDVRRWWRAEIGGWCRGSGRCRCVGHGSPSRSDTTVGGAVPVTLARRSGPAWRAAVHLVRTGGTARPRRRRGPSPAHPRSARRAEQRLLVRPARFGQRAEAVARAVVGVVLVGHGTRRCEQPGDRERLAQDRRSALAGVGEVHDAVERGDGQRARRPVGLRRGLALAGRVRTGREVGDGEGARRPGVDGAVVLRAAVRVGRHRDDVVVGGVVGDHADGRVSLEGQQEQRCAQPSDGDLARSDRRHHHRSGPLAAGPHPARHLTRRPAGHEHHSRPVVEVAHRTAGDGPVQHHRRLGPPALDVEVDRPCDPVRADRGDDELGQRRGGRHPTRRIDRELLRGRPRARTDRAHGDEQPAIDPGRGDEEAPGVLRRQRPERRDWHPHRAASRSDVPHSKRRPHRNWNQLAPGVVATEVTQPEVLLDRPQQAVVVVPLVLEAGLDPIAEQHGVDLVRPVVRRCLVGQVVGLEVRLVERDHDHRPLRQQGLRTGEAQPTEEALEPRRCLVHEPRRAGRRLHVRAVDPVPVAPDVGREPGVVRELAVQHVGEQRGLVLDAPPPLLVAHDRREAGERVVLDEVRRPVLRNELGCPWRRAGDVALHVRPPRQRRRRLLEQIHDRALVEERDPPVARDVVQRPGDRRDVVRLRRVHHAERATELATLAGEPAHVRVLQHVAAVLVLEHEHEHVLERPRPRAAPLHCPRHLSLSMQASRTFGGWFPPLGRRSGPYHQRSSGPATASRRYGQFTDAVDRARGHHPVVRGCVR